MSRLARRIAWSGLLLLAALAVAVDRDAAARAPGPRFGIGRVCVAGLRVALRGGATVEERRALVAAPGGAGCHAGDRMGQLPGSGMLAAMTADGRSVLLLGAQEQPVDRAVSRTVEVLVRRGWVERPAVGLARKRHPGLPLSVVERADAALFVVGVPRSEGRAYVLVAGMQTASDEEEVR
jgi:hypothetical protein